MECRIGCGACCIAPSITSPIPSMPGGKPAGVRCAQLTDDNRCFLFSDPDRPAFCTSLRPSREMCRDSAGQAYAYLAELEQATRPITVVASEWRREVTVGSAIPNMEITG